jgi:hypothetical protein
LLREIRRHAEKAPEKASASREARVLLRCPTLSLVAVLLDAGFQDERVDLSQLQIVVMAF